LVADTKHITSAQLTKVAAALQKQATRDFGHIWDIPANVSGFSKLEDVPTDYWPIIVRDDIKTPGAAGVHEDQNGQPFALVQFSDDWPLTASHETLEMLADLGLIDDLIACGLVARTFQFWDRPSGQLIAEFDHAVLARDTPYPFVVQWEQYKLVRAALPNLWRDRWWRMFDREPITNWVDGRLALTGDAAHPMLQYLAQGACQALEDADCLAGLVAKYGDQHSLGQGGVGNDVDWDAALRDYVELRTVRTARVQRSARDWGDLWHCDGLFRAVRNTLLRDRDPSDYRHIDWLYGS